MKKINEKRLHFVTGQFTDIDGKYMFRYLPDKLHL